MAVGKQAWGAICSMVVAVGLGAIMTTPAIAADLSGNCCADLEERLAEFESTTARKGNRKVSLTISGWINEALFLWDGGTQHNAYLGTNMVEQSRVKFIGEAKINKEWSGWLRARDRRAGPSQQPEEPALRDYRDFPRKSYWYVKSKRLGQVAMGLNRMAPPA
jgi:hypothetical protein